MSPSIEINPPERQSRTTESTVAEAALALSAFMGVAGLPPVCTWTIRTDGVAVAQDGGVVSGQLDIYGLPTARATEARMAALLALAVRFGGVVRVRDLPSSDVLVHTHVEFSFQGVPFAVWAHVLPAALRPSHPDLGASSSPWGHPDVDGFDPCDPSGGAS